MQESNNYVAIMAGGIGSRFWPKSRLTYPKQFLDILGNGRTLLQSTWDRLIRIVPADHIYVLTNEAYMPLVREQLPDIPDSHVLGEPMRKNTAPCIAYFAHKLAAINPKANMMICPSDHLVTKEDSFVQAIQRGFEFVATADVLLTLGIMPTRPDTGYGYIQFKDAANEFGCYPVKTFTEKPTVKIARTFLKSGEFLWNAGIFLWNAKAILQSLQDNLPEVNEAFEQGRKYYNTDQEVAFIEKAFSLCPNISIDYGIMEKASNAFVLPADLGWSDLGTWNSLYEHVDHDYLGNAVLGRNVFIYDAADSLVSAPDEKLVILQGLKDFVVVDTPDVLMICEKKKLDDIKQIASDIKREKGDRFL